MTPPGTNIAPWPYPPTSPVAGREPSWSCPEGICECHPEGPETERIPHTLFLHDEGAVRMPLARCRVYENGQLLEEAFQAGYSVASRRSKREQLTDEFDVPFREAIRAFQLRYFSGRRRRYRNFGAKGKEENRPPLGTVDKHTIDAIVEVWWAAHNT